MPIGDGKTTEKNVRKVFDIEEERNVHFAFERLYDARAARGKFPPQTSDFHADLNGRSLYIECKETRDPDTVSISAFDQFPRMKRKEMAGAAGALIVYHIQERVYRFVPLIDFHLSTRTFKLGKYQTHKDLKGLIDFLEGL